MLLASRDLKQRRDDQAAGLRRILAQATPATMIELIAPGGVGTLVSRLALAAAQAGRDVLVLDATPGEAATALGLASRYELSHVMSGERALTRVLLEGPAGIRVLPAMRGVRTLKPAHLSELAARLPQAADLVIVATRTSVLPVGIDAEPLLAVTPAAAAITAAYGEAKRIAARRRRLLTVIDRAGSEDEARRVHANLADAAERFLGLTVEYAGAVSDDDRRGHSRAASCVAFDSDPAANPADAYARLVARFDRLRTADAPTAAH